MCNSRLDGAIEPGLTLSGPELVTRLCMQSGPTRSDRSLKAPTHTPEVPTSLSLSCYKRK